LKFDKKNSRAPIFEPTQKGKPFSDQNLFPSPTIKPSSPPKNKSFPPFTHPFFLLRDILQGFEVEMMMVKSEQGEGKLSFLSPLIGSADI
jgi:hypothetical protein